MKVTSFMRYFVVAFAAMLVNVFSRMALSYAMPFSASVVVSYILGLVVNYVLSALFVFTAGGGIRADSFVRFTLVSCVGLLVTFAVSMGVMKLFAIVPLPFSVKAQEFAAHICGIGFSFVCNYIGHVLFSFRVSKHHKEDGK